jgi:hypothetical protein
VALGLALDASVSVTDHRAVAADDKQALGGARSEAAPLLHS